MSALEIGHFQGLASKKEFVHNIGLVSTAIEEGERAGFVAQRLGMNIWTQVFGVQYASSAKELGRTFMFIPEKVLTADVIGVYVAGRPVREVGRNYDLPVVPTLNDIQTYCALQAHSPKVISGVATPLLLGGSAVLFFRGNETKPFKPDDALELPLPDIDNPTDLTEAFDSVGLNWTTIRYDGTQPFSGSVDPLFKS